MRQSRGQCLDLGDSFSARRGCHLVRGCRLRGYGSLTAAVAARLAVDIALAAIASAATAVASSAAAFAVLGVVRRAWLSLRDGRLRQVGGARFLRLLRLPRFARRPLFLRFTLAVAARFAVSTRLLLPALRRALLGLVARFAALTVTPCVPAVLTAAVALLAPFRPFGSIPPAAPPVLTCLARWFPPLRSGCRRGCLDRLALEPGHDGR